MENKDSVEIERKVLTILSEINDPEIGINLIDLGLIYTIELINDSEIEILMTYSSKNCPMGEIIQSDIKQAISKEFPDIRTTIKITFEPEWTTDRITENGRKLLST